MSSNKVQTGRFEIVSVPHGEAPLWVREQWVGLIVRGFIGQITKSGVTRGVLSKKTLRSNSDDVHVFEDEALALLAQKSPEAAKWWQDRGYPRGPGFALVFHGSEMRQVSTIEEIDVPLGEIEHHPDEEGPFAHDWYPE